MNLIELLNFLPLIIGVFLAYHLIIRQSLPSKKLGEMFTYFIGILVVFMVISWLITSFLAGWAVDLLQTGTSSNEWQDFIQESEGIVNDAFNSQNNLGNQPPPQPTAVQVLVVTATPIPGQGQLFAPPSSSRTGPTQYTVVAGDTLTRIAQVYGVTPEDIRLANGIVGDLIQVGQVLIIPVSNP